MRRLDVNLELENRKLKFNYRSRKTKNTGITIKVINKIKIK